MESKEAYASYSLQALKKYIEELENTNDSCCRDDKDRMMRLLGFMDAFEETYESLPYEFEIA